MIKCTIKIITNTLLLYHKYWNYWKIKKYLAEYVLCMNGDTVVSVGHMIPTLHSDWSHPALINHLKIKLYWTLCVRGCSTGWGVHCTVSFTQDMGYRQVLHIYDTLQFTKTSFKKKSPRTSDNYFGDIYIYIYIYIYIF